MHKATRCGKEALAENVAYLGMVEDTGQMEGKRGGRSLKLKNYQQQMKKWGKTIRDLTQRDAFVLQLSQVS